MRCWTKTQVNLIKGLMLGIIIVAGFFMASIPHWQYSYPLHTDEWMHISNTESLMRTGSFNYPDPGNGGQPFTPDIEIGYHIWLGTIGSVTGVPIIDITRWLPGIVLGLLAVFVFTLARGSWTGLGAAFLVILAPTTVRFLGPAFLAPVGPGLAFMALALLTVNLMGNNREGLAFLWMELLALFFIHPPTFAVTAAGVLVHLIFQVTGSTRGDRRRILFTSLVIVLIFVFGYFWARTYAEFNIGEAFNSQSERGMLPINNIVRQLGYIPTGLFCLGAGVLAFRGGRVNLAVLVMAGGLVGFQVLYRFTQFGPDIIYERGWLYVYVLMSIIGGAALGQIWSWQMALFKQRRRAGIIAAGIITLLLIASSFGLSLNRHLEERYYRLVDDASYQTLVWVRQHVPQEYQTGIIAPGLAYPFTAITGKYSYTGEVAPRFLDKSRVAADFFLAGANDTGWLTGENISIVYTPEPVNNHDLIKINANLYLLQSERHRR